MKRNMKSKSIYFLMELMIVLFFFAFSATICVHFAMESYSRSQHGNDLRVAMSQGTNVVEQIQATHQLPKSETFISDGREYDMVVTSMQDESKLISGTIVIKQGDAILITLPFAYGEAQ